MLNNFRNIREQKNFEITAEEEKIGDQKENQD
jgi:hypothetical protein